MNGENSDCCERVVNSKNVYTNFRNLKNKAS